MTEQPEAEEQKSQPLIEHLLELRSRILRSIVAIALIFLCLFAFANQIYDLLSEPLRAQLPEGASMIATDVISPFMAPLKFTLFVSAMLAMPYVLYQAWAFIAPGLYANEKKIALPIFASSVILFYSGIAFAYFVIIKLVTGFIISVAPDSIAVMTDINSYLSFVLKLFFAFGLAFEIPIATILLVRAGATTTESLAAKRPYIIVGCLIVGMLMTPPDIFSQLFLAGPMWLLFEAGLIFARYMDPHEQEKKRQARQSRKQDSDAKRGEGKE